MELEANQWFMTIHFECDKIEFLVKALGLST